MKIHLKNFGAIHNFEFDLAKDFHVIYGKNNIGKSYAMSAVYLILKHLIQTEIHSKFLNFYTKDKAEILEKLASNKIDLKPVFDELIINCLDEIFITNLNRAFQNSYSENLNNTQNKFTENQFVITIFLSKKLSFSLEIKNENLLIKSLKIQPEIYNEIESIFDKKDTENNLTPKNIKEEISVKTSSFLSSVFMGFEQNFNAYFLPASRSGLYEGISSLSALFAELSKFRNQISSKIEIPTLSEPIADYFLNISTIQVKNQDHIYQKFAQEIEQKLLNAEIVFNEETKKLEYFNSDIKLKLNLSETSSMVSEIAPIVAHFKYLINNNDENKYKVIFIEEPEAHLHPEIQVLLTEIFLELTKHKVKIVMTTHSNYIFNKINNLLLQKSIETNKIAVYHMVHTEKGSVVSEDSKISETGIEDNNFAETAEKLYNERFETLD